MNKKDDKKEFANDDILLIIIVLILGVLILSVGLLTFYTKMAGTRWIGVVEGIWPQIGGIMFILFGIYLIISSIKKLVIYKNRKKDH